MNLKTGMSGCTNSDFGTKDSAWHNDGENDGEQEVNSLFGREKMVRARGSCHKYVDCSKESYICSPEKLSLTEPGDRKCSPITEIECQLSCLDKEGNVTISQPVKQQCSDPENNTRPSFQKMSAVQLSVLDNFSGSSIEEQIKLLTSHKELFSGELFDQCTTEQRKKLSNHDRFPTHCRFALNVRLIEDVITPHIKEHTGGLFRYNNASSVLNESVHSFDTKNTRRVA